MRAAAAAAPAASPPSRSSPPSRQSSINQVLPANPPARKKKKPKICAGCNDVIEGKFMRVLNGTWHTVCFVCEGCGGPLSDGYIEANGKPYCARCL